METNLDHYLDAWQLSDPQPLAQTATSRVYTVTHQGEQVVLKLLTPIGVKDEHQGTIALDYWNGHGAVHLLRAGTRAHLLEYAPGEELVALVRRGDDEQATRIIADLLNKLHIAPTASPPHGLIPLRQRFQSVFERAAAAPADSVFVRAARLIERLLAEPREVRVLHGDMHHYNVRWHPDRGWLAFDPKGLVGERTYDAANTLCNPNELPSLVHDEGRLLNNARILAQAMQMDLPRVLAFTYAYTALSASWSLDIDNDPTYALRVGQLIEPHLTE